MLLEKDKKRDLVLQRSMQNIPIGAQEKVKLALQLRNLRDENPEVFRESIGKVSEDQVSQINVHFNIMVT